MPWPGDLARGGSYLRELSNESDSGVGMARAGAATARAGARHTRSRPGLGGGPTRRWWGSTAGDAAGSLEAL